jgi:hypothetical protein
MRRGVGFLSHGVVADVEQWRESKLFGLLHDRVHGQEYGIRNRLVVHRIRADVAVNHRTIAVVHFESRGNRTRNRLVRRHGNPTEHMVLRPLLDEVLPDCREIIATPRRFARLLYFESG